MTADLVVAFLNARLDEDEQAANAAAYVAPGRWSADIYQNSRGTMSGGLVAEADFTDERLGWDGRLWGGRPGPGTAAEVAEHLARHDPARVLADVQAKRAILAIHEGRHRCPNHLEWEEEPCTTLRLLAQPFADHPDFRPEWGVSLNTPGVHPC